MSKAQKKALRAVIRGKREQLQPAYLEEAGKRIAEQVIRSELFQNSRVLFAYISVKGEPDTRAIIETALKAGKTVCVPKCFGKGVMTAVPIQSYADLQPGLMDIPEPADWSHPIGEEMIDLGIIPCVSANRKGERIGHGAGYYDDFLDKTDCTTVCLCFEKLVTEPIPMKAHDHFMDYLATEEGLCRTRET